MFWNASLPFNVGTEPTRTLCATDLLLSVLAHAYASHARVIRWVPDVAMIVRVADGQIDWDKLADLASRRHLVLPVRDALRYLDDSGLVPVPIAAIRTFESARPGWTDRAEYAHRQSDTPYLLSNKLARLWFWHWRQGGQAAALVTAIRIPGFLRRYASH
jgi:hypothetical protein